MCGRTFCTLDPTCILKDCAYKNSHGEIVQPEWKDSPTGEHYRPSVNIGPTIFTPVLISAAHYSASSTTRVIQPMRWGLVPAWHKGNRTNFKTMHNNCRSETVLSKPTFSVPLKKGRRCVVIAEGFYEWKTVEKKKIPHLFTMSSYSLPTVKTDVKQDFKPAKIKSEVKSELTGSDSASDERLEKQAVKAEVSGSDLLFMAGIFDVCQEEGSSLYSYSILTTESVGSVAQIHHRMPVILRGDGEIERWLNYEEYPADKVMDLMTAHDCLKFYEVSDKVNNIRCQEADCCRPIDRTKKKPLVKGDIRNWFSQSANVKRKSEPSDNLTDVCKKVKSENRV